MINSYYSNNDGETTNKYNIVSIIINVKTRNI